MTDTEKVLLERAIAAERRAAVAEARLARYEPPTTTAGFAWLIVPTQLIGENRQAFKARINVLLNAQVPPTRIVLDFAECAYIDSSGLGGLVTVSKSCHEHRVPLVLRGLTDDLLTLFKLTKMDTLFTIED